MGKRALTGLGSILTIPVSISKAAIRGGQYDSQVLPHSEISRQPFIHEKGGSQGIRT